MFHNITRISSFLLFVLLFNENSLAFRITKYKKHNNNLKYKTKNIFSSLNPFDDDEVFLIIIINILIYNNYYYKRLKQNSYLRFQMKY